MSLKSIKTSTAKISSIWATEVINQPLLQTNHNLLSRPQILVGRGGRAIDRRSPVAPCSPRWPPACCQASFALSALSRRRQRHRRRATGAWTAPMWSLADVEHAGDAATEHSNLQNLRTPPCVCRHRSSQAWVTEGNSPGLKDISGSDQTFQPTVSQSGAMK